MRNARRGLVFAFVAGIAVWCCILALASCAPAAAQPVSYGCRGQCNTSGVNVTSQSASCVAVDTNVLKVDCANNRVGVNKTPAVEFDVSGASFFDGGVSLGNGNIVAPLTLNKFGRAQFNSSANTAFAIAAITNGAGGAVHLQGPAGATLIQGDKDSVGFVSKYTADGDWISCRNWTGTGTVQTVYIDAGTVHVSGSAYVGGGIDAGTLYVAGEASFGAQDAGNVNMAGALTVAGGISMPTNALLDFGGGSGDYCYSNGTNLRCAMNLYIDATTGGGVLVAAASGNNALSVTTSGARVDFGAGASDYATSDSTTVTFAAPLTTAGILTAAEISVTGSTAKGYVVADGGTTQAVGVLGGEVCACSNASGTSAVWCNVAATTLSIHSDGASKLAYVCL